MRPFHSHLRVNISVCEREKQNRSTRASDFSTAHYTVRSYQTRRGETIPYKAAIPFAARHFCPARASAFTWISGGFAARHFCVEIFKLCREIRVMTANQRSTAWPLSDVRNVTANQFSTGQPFPAVQSGVNRSMEEKVIVAVCDSPSSI